MHKKNGVYNFKVKVPVSGAAVETRRWGNRFAALMEECDKCGEEENHFQRQGGR